MREALQVIPIQCSFIIFDGTNAVLSGILRGCGKQRVGFFACLVSYYALGLPVGLYLTFTKEMGLAGLWYGLAVGSICACVLQGSYIRNVKWKEVAEEAAERVNMHRVSEGRRISLAARPREHAVVAAAVKGASERDDAGLMRNAATA